MILTPEQQAILDLFCDPRLESKFYILNAPAGTGKTTLIKQIYAHIPGVQIIAPTNKAVSLFEGLGAETNGKLKAVTIHRFFGSTTDYDAASGKREFKFKAPKISKTRLLIVDEASMVNKAMLSAFLNISLPILFTCDRAQVPPVGEDISPLYTVKDVVHLSLSQNLRARTADCTSILTRFREAADDVKSPFPPSTTLVSLPVMEVEDLFLNEPSGCVILCWTNERRCEWNKTIRSSLFNSRGSTIEAIYEGEVLIFTGHRLVTAPKPCTYNTSDMIKVQQLVKMDQNVLFTPASCKHSPIGQEGIAGCTICGIKRRSTPHLNIEFYLVTDQNDVEWLVPVSDEDQGKVEDILAHYKSYIMKKAPQYRKRDWEAYYKLKDYLAPDLDYAYAMTVHKAQGSEWDHVFVDYENIARCARLDGSLCRKLLYTAVSRMCERVYRIDLENFEQRADQDQKDNC